VNTYNFEGQCADVDTAETFQTEINTQSTEANHRTDLDDKYGLSSSEYQALVEDCEESVEMYTHIHHFLTTDADAISYLF
jgi:hypothetical protein